MELDPLSLQMNTYMGMLFWGAHRFDEAIEQLKKVLDMERNFWLAHHWLFANYVRRERYEDALATLQKMHDLAGTTVPITHMPEYAGLHAFWGKRDEALRPLSAPGWAETPPFARAVVYGALGEKDEAIRLLQQLHAGRSPFLAVAKIDPRLDPLRDDPRFQDLLRRMNFPE